MPLREGVLIACKDGIVELTVEISEPHRDAPDALVEAIRDNVVEHQLQAMTDEAILDPDNLRVSSCLFSRDPLPPEVTASLRSLGFEAATEEGGGREQRSLFSRFQRGSKRTKLDKWRTIFLRAEDVSARLAEVERILIDTVPEGPLGEVADMASHALVEAAREIWRLPLSPSLEDLGHLERRIVQERSGVTGRLILHPAAIRGLAAFTAEVIMQQAPGSSWSEDPEDEAPLHVVTRGNAIVASDPEFRVAKFVARGSKEMLTTYVESLLSQSANHR